MDSLSTSLNLQRPAGFLQITADQRAAADVDRNPLVQADVACRQTDQSAAADHQSCGMQPISIKHAAGFLNPADSEQFKAGTNRLCAFCPSTYSIPCNPITSRGNPKLHDVPYSGASGNNRGPPIVALAGAPQPVTKEFNRLIMLLTSG